MFTVSSRYKSLRRFFNHDLKRFSLSLSFANFPVSAARADTVSSFGNLFKDSSCLLVAFIFLRSSRYLSMFSEYTLAFSFSASHSVFVLMRLKAGLIFILAWLDARILAASKLYFQGV